MPPLAQARRIASRGGLVLLVLWALTLLLVMLVPLALPPEKGGSFYATTALTPGEEIDWLNLYIPANPYWTFTGFNRAAAYSLVHPELAAVVPAPDLGSVPIAIVAPKGEEPLIDFTNAFVAGRSPATCLGGGQTEIS